MASFGLPYGNPQVGFLGGAGFCPSTVVKHSSQEVRKNNSTKHVSTYLNEIHPIPHNLTNQNNQHSNIKRNSIHRQKYANHNTISQHSQAGAPLVDPNEAATAFIAFSL